MARHKILHVQKGHGLRDYEKFMKIAQEESVGNTRLKIPQSISFEGALGRSLSFSQLIATWANVPTKTCQRNIQTRLPVNNQDILARFVSRLHGLVAAYYADLITAEDDKTNLKHDLLKAASPRIVAMANRNYSEVARGRMTELIFVHRTKHQFHSAVYLKEPNNADLMDRQRHGELVVPPREMNALLLNVLSALNLSRMDFDRLKPLLYDSKNALGHLLHETFRNTAEHAYLDIENKIPSKGVRCLLVAVRQTEPKMLKPITLASAEHPGLDQYFEQLCTRKDRGVRSKVHILELSIFDTGPGFADTISAHKNFDTGVEDHKIVQQCFHDYVSSKGGPNSGLGLGRVLSHISDLDGFVRVRTSTTEAFFTSFSEITESKLTPHIAGNLPMAIGTVITIAIPLES